MAKSDEGRELHREFVGMLFALAIGEVATDAAIVANSSVESVGCLPTYFHLFLAASVIAASWVGWGKSDHSLSNINSIFTFDFLELLVDLWLVVLYFFLVKAVELPSTKDPTTINPNALGESKWILIIFATYFFWDLVTKVFAISSRDSKDQCVIDKNKGRWFLRDGRGGIVVIQRGWASLACAGLAYLAHRSLHGVTSDVAHVLLADLSLLCLVLLFRAMKLRNLTDLFINYWVPALILGLLLMFGVFLAAATDTFGIGPIIVRWTNWLLGNS